LLTEGFLFQLPQIFRSSEDRFETNRDLGGGYPISGKSGRATGRAGFGIATEKLGHQPTTNQAIETKESRR